MKNPELCGTINAAALEEPTSRGGQRKLLIDIPGRYIINLDIDLGDPFKALQFQARLQLPLRLSSPVKATARTPDGCGRSSTSWGPSTQSETSTWTVCDRALQCNDVSAWILEQISR